MLDWNMVSVADTIQDTLLYMNSDFMKMKEKTPKTTKKSPKVFKEEKTLHIFRHIIVSSDSSF